MTDEAIAKMENEWQLQKEAARLLELVVAEWESDPHTVIGFDLRIVEKSKQVIEELKAIHR